MTIEEIKALDMEGVESRSMEIKDEMTAENADLETLSAEVEALEERKKALVEEMKQAQAAVVGGAGKEIEKEEEKRNMPTMMEVRSSEAYVNAYAEYIKSGDDQEVRSVLTENGVPAGATSAGVPVPTVVEGRIRTAWDKDAILSRVKRSNVAGILKVGFELSATGAAVHAEGAAAPTEETLNLGIVSLVPETLKKWITISDEAFDMKGQAFLDYIMDEIEYRIIKLAADTVVADITSAPTTATKTAASVAHVVGACRPARPCTVPPP
jgi:HK97 family phage major capsid protein